MLPLKTNGSAPTNEIVIHVSPTVKNPSLAYISFFVVLTLHNAIAIGDMSNIVNINDFTSASL